MKIIVGITNNNSKSSDPKICPGEVFYTSVMWLIAWRVQVVERKRNINEEKEKREETREEKSYLVVSTH